MFSLCRRIEDTNIVLPVEGHSLFIRLQETEFSPLPLSSAFTIVPDLDVGIVFTVKRRIATY